MINKNNLLLQAITKYVSGIILVFLLLFIPAGSLNYMHGHLLMFLLFVPMFFAGIIMYFKAPDLLKSRLNAKETQNEQKDVVFYSGIMFLVSFILAGLNYRFNWTSLPQSVVIISCIIFLLSYIMFGFVLKQNAYLSRTIEIQENQSVVEDGLYGIVRHPMYTATLFLFLTMPLILNSLPSFIIMLTYIPIIIKRIKNEEELLEQELKGYKEYKQKIKYRLIPYIY